MGLFGGEEDGWEDVEGGGVAVSGWMQPRKRAELLKCPE